MKKIRILLLALTLVVVGLPVHNHDNECGYNPETNSGCMYEEEVNPFFLNDEYPKG